MLCLNCARGDCFCCRCELVAASDSPWKQFMFYHYPYIIPDRPRRRFELSDLFIDNPNFEASSPYARHKVL